MPRTTFARVILLLFAVPLLAVLALTLPGTALAGPPEGVSGKMVLDEVVDRLRRYRRETNPSLRAELLADLAFPEGQKRYAQTRVWRWRWAKRLRIKPAAVRAVAFASLSTCCGPEPSVDAVCAWWRDNEADLRRRAKQLPQ